MALNVVKSEATVEPPSASEPLNATALQNAASQKLRLSPVHSIALKWAYCSGFFAVTSLTDLM